MNKITDQQFEELKNDAIEISSSYMDNCNLYFYYADKWEEGYYFLIKAKGQWYQYDKSELYSEELKSIRNEQHDEWMEFVKKEAELGILHQW